MLQLAKVIRQLVVLTSALTLVGCGTSQLVGVPALRSALGNSLYGAQGKTIADQNKIDRTMAPGCAIKLYTTKECEAHTKASAERRSELRT